MPAGTNLPGTTIEIIRPVSARGARAVLFDFDGTLSLIRSGCRPTLAMTKVQAYRARRKLGKLVEKGLAEGWLDNETS